MSRAKLAVKAEWILQDGAQTRNVPVSERVVVEDDDWRFVTEKTELDSGMRVFLSSADVRRPVTIAPRQTVPGIWIAANIAVQGIVDVALTGGAKVSIDERTSALFRPVDDAASFSPAPDRPLKLAGYMLRDDRVARLFDGDIPGPIRPLLARRLETSLILSMPATSRLRRIARSLFAPKLNGPLRAIYMEGAVLQLFAQQAAGYGVRLNDRARGTLGPKERAAIEAAREWLLSDMRSPPTLGELAASAGISEKALNRGFRTLYGTTVFETLRDERLAHARFALQTEDVPLKTIAHRVGYNHVTNFIVAFTRRFGAPPRRSLRQIAEETEEIRDKA